MFFDSIAVGRRVISTIAALGLGAVVVSGCETVDGLTNDPFEDVNRVIFDFNNDLDNAFFEPVAEVYIEHVPDTIRTAVLNSLRHLKSPVIFANNVFQGDVNGAGKTLSRFVTNTILGFGGMVDTAAKSGLPFRDEDFGQTLAVWGVGEGPYLMIPVLGPMNIRDGAGKLADSFISSLGEIDNTAFEWTHRGVDAVDTRAGLLDTLDDLERTSLDYYAAIRSLYRQKRRDDILNGENDAPVPVPNISFDDEDEKKDATLKPIISFDDEGEKKPTTPLGVQTSANLK
tara:strand:- start:190 stop:1047 length:858 start_codon:yes stop_codon:yes gene_type:complete